MKSSSKIIRGQSLIELLIVMALASIILPAVMTGFLSSREGKSQQQQREKAVGLLREAEEATRYVRNKGWSSFVANGTYHPIIESNQWTLVTGSESLSGLTRQIVVSDVYRDTSGTVVTSGGTLDPSSKKVVITVSWTAPSTSSVQSTMYFTRYQDNASYVQTTQTDFNSGTKTNVQVTNTSGGEITLSNNTKGKWCEPQLAPVSIDLPGVPNAVTAIEGHVYVATGQTATAGQDSFAHVLVGNTDPPTFTLHGKIKGYKTNAVFGESGWGYIATTDDSKEVVIINLNQFDDAPNKIYHQEGTFNATGSTDGDRLFVLNNRGYITAGQYLYVFDLSSKSGSRPIIGTRISFANSGDTAGGLYVQTVGSSTYAYVGILGSTPEELKIINVTNHNISSQWRVVGSINIEPNGCSALESGKSVFVKPDGSRAYISSVNDTTFKEFFIINTSNKSSPSLVGGFATNPPCTNGGGYEANGMNPEQSSVVSILENRAILVGTDATGDAVNAEEYQVLDLSSESAPTKCGAMQFDQGIYGVAAVKESDGDAYAYLITGDASSELKVVQGGPDGIYVDSGTYESQTFGPGHITAFNRLSTGASTPANTTLTYQIAIADQIAGSCSGVTFSYVGPDGTSGTYYPYTGGTIHLNDDGSGYENPGWCFRYKAYFSTTNYNSSPIINDITVNYSP